MGLVCGYLGRPWRVLYSLLVLWFLCATPQTARCDPPFRLPATEELERIRSAVIKTSEGEIYLELFPEDAPWHVANFKYLADKGYYKNTIFHIYERGYIIQGGARTLSGRDSPGYTLPPEFSKRKHDFGVLGMARRPNEINPGRVSHGAQFHLLLGAAKHMDGGYTIFGKVASGLDVLQKLKRGSRILNVTVFVRPLEPLDSEEERSRAPRSHEDSTPRRGDGREARTR